MMIDPQLTHEPLLAAGAISSPRGPVAKLTSPGGLRAVVNITALDSVLFITLAAWRCLRFRKGAES
jgi:hypothetical protein